MSLSDRLQALKSKLTHTKTTVRTPDGKTFEEDFSPDTGHSSVPLTSVPDSFGFVVDTEPDLELSDILRGRVWMGSQDVAADYEKLKEAEISHILNVGTGNSGNQKRQ